MKWLIFLALLLLLALHIQDPFDPNNLYTEIPKGSEEISDLLPYLDQPYHYLNQGSQMIAFVSKDGQYVLKLFKARHEKSFKITRLYRKLTKSPKEWSHSQHKWHLKFKDTCRRYKIAYAFLRKETALLGLHLHHTSAPLLITLKGRTSRQIDLSKYPFILQKKALPAPKYARKNPEKAKVALQNLFKTRLEKGYSDPRQTLSTNYGFIDGRAIQLDIGKIEKFEGDKTEELTKIYAKIDEWISAL